MKSVQIRSFFWSKDEEIRSRKNFLFAHFLHNEYASEFTLRFCKVIEKLKAYKSTLRDSIKGNFMWEIFQIFYSFNFTDPKPMESDSGKILDMTILWVCMFFSQSICRKWAYESILSSGFQKRLFLLLEKQIKNYFTLFCNASPNKHLPAQSW